MGAARITRTVSMTVGYKLTLEEMEAFAAEVRAAGMERPSITWHADPGSQMEPSQLTFTAVPG